MQNCWVMLHWLFWGHQLVSTDCYDDAFLAVVIAWAAVNISPRSCFWMRPHFNRFFLELRILLYKRGLGMPTRHAFGCGHTMHTAHKRNASIRGGATSLSITRFGEMQKPCFCLLASACIKLINPGLHLHSLTSLNLCSSGNTITR